MSFKKVKNTRTTAQKNKTKKPKNNKWLHGSISKNNSSSFSIRY